MANDVAWVPIAGFRDVHAAESCTTVGPRYHVLQHYEFLPQPRTRCKNLVFAEVLDYLCNDRASPADHCQPN